MNRQIDLLVPHDRGLALVGYQLDSVLLVPFMDATLQAFVANFKSLPTWVLQYGFPFAFLFFLLIQRFLIRRVQKKITFFSSEKLRIMVGLKNPLTLVILAIYIRLAGMVYKFPGDWKDIFILTPKILTFLALALFARHVLLLFAGRLLKINDSLSMYEAMVRVLIHLVVYSMLAIVVLDLFGISVTPLVASLGIGSAAIALSFQKTLTNFVSGLHILVDRPLRVGDYIKLETGEEGFVEQIGWRNSRIRTSANNIVIMPNTKLADTTFINYNLPQRELILPIEIAIDYESDLEKVEAITIEVAKNLLQSHPGGIKNFNPQVQFHTFSDLGVLATVSLRVREFSDQGAVKSSFIKALHNRFKAEGIVIPYPHRVVVEAKKEG